MKILMYEDLPHILLLDLVGALPGMSSLLMGSKIPLLNIGRYLELLLYFGQLLYDILWIQHLEGDLRENKNIFRYGLL